ncbi:MAG: ABC transporter ATP-binding protein [Chloroflexota bacterium]
MVNRPRSNRRSRANKEDLKSPPDRATLGRLLRLALPYRKQLILASICLVISTLLQLTFPLLIQRIVDGAITYHDGDIMTTAAIQMVGVFLLQAVFNYGQLYLLSFTGERLVADVRKSVFTHLQRLPLGFYDNQRVGELTSRLSNDVSVVQSGLTNNLIGPIGQVLTLVGGVGMIILIDWRLILLVLLVIPPVALTGVFFGRRLQGVSEQAQSALGTATTVLEETLAAPRVVKAFGRETYEVERYGGAVEESFRLGMRRVRTRAVFIAIITLVSFVALASIMWFGGMEVLNGNLSPGQLFSLPLYILLATGPINALTGVYAQFQEASGAARRLFEILDTEPEIADAPDAFAMPSPARGEVALRNVTFHYGGGPDVLKDLSLEIEAGKVVALVGPSGAGKTTLASLIPRFYDVASGAVLVDGYDVRQVTVRSLRDAIAIVPQEPQLFGGTVFDNILYGRLDATAEEVYEAARGANAHSFISELPDGYSSIVGERGVKLSGGQRQRVAIARAILRNPRILILDEATSSLDNESERLVRQALERLMRGRTTLIIAHRLSTVEQADKIAVIESGNVAELGTHAELLAQNGLYHRLYMKSAAGLPLEEMQPTTDLEELATREAVGTS